MLSVSIFLLGHPQKGKKSFSSAFWVGLFFVDDKEWESLKFVSNYELVSIRRWVVFFRDGIPGLAVYYEDWKVSLLEGSLFLFGSWKRQGKQPMV